MTRARDVANIDGVLTTTGDTYYASAAATPNRLGIGSTGQVMTVAGGVSSWATPAGGTLTIASVASGSLNTGDVLSLTGLTQDYLQLQLTGLTWDTSNDNLYFTLNSSSAAVYTFPQIITNYNSPNISAMYTNNDKGGLGVLGAGFPQDRTSASNSYTLKLTNCKATGFTTFSVETYFLSLGGNWLHILSSGVFASAAAITSIQVATTIGRTFNGSGTYKLIGG